MAGPGLLDGQNGPGLLRWGTPEHPSYLPQLEPLYGLLRDDPEVVGRATLLPLKDMADGGLEFGVPGLLMDLARGGVDLLAGPQTGVMTPEALNTLASLPAMGQSPAGSLATFAGRRAATAPLDDLARAERMAADGVDERAIWRDTGWFKGADDQWRWEIDDSGARPNRVRNADGEVEGAQWVDEMVDGRLTVLKDAFAHPELYEAYPEAKHVFYGLKEGGGAQFTNEPAPTIRIGKKDFYNPPENEADWLRSPTLHEGQHFVQEREGFAQGGNASFGWSKDDQWAFAKEAYERAKGIGGGMSDDELLAELLGTPKPTTQPKPWDALTDREKLGWLQAGREHGYHRLAGEAEARAVQKRMDYSPEQRRAVFPFDDYDVPRDKLIVRGQGLLDEPQMSAGPGMLDLSTEARMARAREMGFDTERPVYHGTKEPLRSFDRDYLGEATGQDAGAFWFTENKGQALSYGRAASDPDTFFGRRKGNVSAIPSHVEEVMLRGNIKDIDLLEEARNVAAQIGAELPTEPAEALAILGDDWRRVFLEQARSDGYDGARFLNVWDDPGGSAIATHVAIFDPRNIRSVHARFDPAQAGSADLLASRGSPHAAMLLAQRGERRTGGLLDEAGAEPGLLGAMQSPGGVAASGAMAKKATRADRLAQYLDEMGLQFERKRSGMSGSQYFNVYRVDDAGNSIDAKIRISDHDLPPSYKAMHGEAEYEIGPHGEAAEGGLDGALAFLSQKFGIEPPKSRKGHVAKVSAARASEAASRQAVQSNRAIVDQFVVEHPDLSAEAFAAFRSVGTDADQDALQNALARLTKP